MKNKTKTQNVKPKPKNEKQTNSVKPTTKSKNITKIIFDYENTTLEL